MAARGSSCDTFISVHSEPLHLPKIRPCTARLYTPHSAKQPPASALLRAWQCSTRRLSFPLFICSLHSILGYSVPVAWVVPTGG